MSGSEPAATLDRLRATARDLVSLTSGVDRAVLTRKPGAREWSAAQVVGHLADAELVYAFRLKTILSEERPHIQAYDENAWTERFARVEEDLKDTLARWRMLREHNLRLLESLEEPEWRRAGVHAERGEMTIRNVATRMAEHDRGHLDQIRRALAG